MKIEEVNIDGKIIRVKVYKPILWKKIQKLVGMFPSKINDDNDPVIYANILGERIPIVEFSNNEEVLLFFNSMRKRNN